MRKWFYVMCLALLLSLTATVCNSSDKSDKSKAAIAGAVPGMTQLASNTSPLIYPDRIKKLDEKLFAKVDHASSAAGKQAQKEFLDERITRPSQKESNGVEYKGYILDSYDLG